MNRPRRSLLGVLLPVLVFVSSAGLAGCGKEELTDEAYGYIDLAPYYYDGSTPSSPRAGLPTNMRPQRGWLNGVRAEYYDFGLVTVARKRSDSKVPDYANVNPIYFFFDSTGAPLAMNPVYESRTGLWHMRGGKDVLNPNPSTSGQGTNRDPRKQPYSVRVRATMKDRARKMSDDYQRPIVDKINQDSLYSGLWEVVEITVPDGYEPDAIKGMETLQKGLDSGDFVERRTQKVINCPLVDDATYLVPSVMAYGIPRPRIEVWYKTKLGSCYLVNGWETLGDANAVLYKAKSATRIDTFDTITFTIQPENTPKSLARTTVVAPVGKAWIPMVRVANQDPLQKSFEIRYGNEVLTEAMPRSWDNQQPGYRPIRWLHDITVAQDPPFEAGTYRSLDRVDPAINKKRGDDPWTRNIGLIGVARGCTTNDDCAGLTYGPNVGPNVALECNPAPDENLLHGDLPAGRSTYRDLIEAREGGPRCDAPAVRFGEYCSPGIGRCASPAKDKDNMTDIGTPLGETEVKPKWYDQNAGDKENTAAVLGGYACHPLPTGYCYLRCDSDASNSTSSSTTYKAMLKYELGSEGRTKTEEVSMPLDSRCGNLPGYQCINPSFSPGPPSRLRLCLRTCSGSDPATKNDARCRFPLEMDVNEKAFGNVQKGMTCKNTGLADGRSACVWDPAFEPRDPNTIFTPADAP